MRRDSALASEPESPGIAQPDGRNRSYTQPVSRLWALGVVAMGAVVAVLAASFAGSDGPTFKRDRPGRIRHFIKRLVKPS
jgi:hypothetical protein